MPGFHSRPNKSESPGLEFWHSYICLKTPQMIIQMCHQIGNPLLQAMGTSKSEPAHGCLNPQSPEKSGS